MVDAPERQQQEEVIDPRGVAFIPPTDSSTKRPMYYDDFAKLIGEERLAALSQTYPRLVGGDPPSSGRTCGELHTEGGGGETGDGARDGVEETRDQGEGET